MNEFWIKGEGSIKTEKDVRDWYGIPTNVEITTELAESYGFVPIVPIIKPVAAEGEYVFRDGVETNEEGLLLQKWSKMVLTASEIESMRLVEVQSKVAAIKAERDRRKFGGVLVDGKWIHTDTYSRTQWMSMRMMGAAVPAIDWTTMTGSIVQITPTLVAQVFQAIATSDATLFAIAKSHINAITISPDPFNYNIYTGWTPIFGE